MAKTKRKQLAAIATKRKEAGSNLAASQGLTLHDVDDSWIEVRKQRIVIVIPPLPKAKLKPPSAIAAKLVRPGLKKSSSGRIISSKNVRGGKGRKLVPKANVSSARQSHIDDGEATPASESKGKRKWSSVLSTKGTKRRRPTSTTRDDSLATPRISSMDILLASVDSLNAEEAARDKLCMAASDNQETNGTLAKGKRGLYSELASRASLDVGGRKIQQNKFLDTKMTSPELSAHGASHLQKHASKRRGISADDRRLLLKHVRKRRNLHEVRADDGNILPKHATEERTSHDMADHSRPLQESTPKGENLHGMPFTGLERKTVISNGCLNNRTANPLGKGRVVHGVNRFLSEANAKPSSLRRKEKAFPNYPHMPLITANQAFKVLTLKRQLERAGGLSRWLLSVGLGQFTEMFERRMFSELELLQLNMDDLKRMWKPAVGPRRKLICAIEHLSQQLE